MLRFSAEELGISNGSMEDMAGVVSADVPDLLELMEDSSELAAEGLDIFEGVGPLAGRDDLRGGLSMTFSAFLALNQGWERIWEIESLLEGVFTRIFLIRSRTSVCHVRIDDQR